MIEIQYKIVFPILISLFLITSFFYGYTPKNDNLDVNFNECQACDTQLSSCMEIIDDANSEIDSTVCIGNPCINPSSWTDLINSVSYYKSLSEANLSFVLFDIFSCNGVCYNPRLPMYAKSTIKAPYIYSLIDCNPEIINSDKQEIIDTLQKSSDEAYKNLRLKYGSSTLISWCRDFNIALSVGAITYPADITSIDLCKFWLKTYSLLPNFNDSQKNVLLSSVGSKRSVIYDRLGSGCKVISKAGWDYIDDTNTDGSLSNMNDAGICEYKGRPFIIVVLSNLPGRTEELNAIVDSLFNVEKDIINR